MLTIPYKEREVINRLSKNPRILVVRQDKGRGTVIMDKGKYTEKMYGNTQYQTIL